MNNEQKNLKNSIKKAMKTPTPLADDGNKYSQTAENTEDYSNTQQNQYDEKVDTTFPGNEVYEKAERKRVEKPLKIFGALCIAVAIIAFIVTPTTTVDTSEAAKRALKEGISTGTSAGVVLSSSDKNMEAKDHTITHKSDAKDTKIWVWDYAAEDGDYVQVLVNGAIVSDAFMIKHKPREIVVPAAGEVQIKGIRDGGGGITYAVRYEVNGTSYFNGTPEGQLNTYTLRKE